MQETEYKNVVVADTFTITTVCNECDSTNCFIGIRDNGWVVICANCGHTEAGV